MKGFGLLVPGLRQGMQDWKSEWPDTKQLKCAWVVGAELLLGSNPSFPCNYLGKGGALLKHGDPKP